jgi:hypothetical protein
MAIWQDLGSDYGFASGYQTVKRCMSSTGAHCVEHQLIPLFVFNVLDRPNEHTPADRELPFRCLQLAAVPYPIKRER